MSSMLFFCSLTIFGIITVHGAEQKMATYQYDNFANMVKCIRENTIGYGFLLNQKNKLKTLTVYTDTLHEIGNNICQGFAVKDTNNGSFLIYQIQFDYAKTQFQIFGNTVVYGEIDTWEKIKQKKCYSHYEAYETINSWLVDTSEKKVEIRKDR